MDAATSILRLFVHRKASSMSVYNAKATAADEGYRFWHTGETGADDSVIH